MRQAPRLRLPESTGTFRPGMLGSALLHLLVLVALVWGASQAPPGNIRAVGPPGPQGGGGGGSMVRFISLPPAGSPAAQPDVVQPPAAQRITQLPLPTPNVREIARAVSPFTLPTDLGSLAKVEGPTGPLSGGGEGQGAAPGSGGGVGTGEGGGVGAGTGSGTGRGRGDLFLAEPRQLVLPPSDAPASVKGRDYTVTFTLDARGRVRRVDVDPTIPDAGYRKQFMDSMREMLFYPARTLDGAPIESRFVIVVTPGG